VKQQFKFSRSLVAALIMSLCSINLWSTSAFAKLSVVTTSSDIAAIASEIGAGDVNVDALGKGSQDLHTLEPKPSFMARLSRADLLIANGLQLEIGWLPSVIRGARNPKLNPGQSGYLELGDKLQPIEVGTAQVTRAAGDVHPDGNPHWTLDPIRVAKAGMIVAERFGELDSANASKYIERAKKFEARLTEKTKQWSERIKKSGVKEVVTYHKTLNYFLDRFDVKGVGYLEPKPGIPPTAQHILDLIKTVKERGVRLILVEHYYDDKAAVRVASDFPAMIFSKQL
jgi:zinc/manganese transport system substrate-binding protein